MAHLEAEQEELFQKLVEALRSVPREQRTPFMFLRAMQADLIQGNGLSLQVLHEDVMALEDADLIRTSSYHSKGSGFNFIVPPSALRYYEELKARVGGPAAQLEEEQLRYLEGDEFRQRYPVAYARWKEAAELLWKHHSTKELSTIGHKCREAVQEFVSALIERGGIEDANPDKAKTRDRLSAVLKSRRETLSDAHLELLDALFGYWKAAGDLIQRQEHEAQKEGDDLEWEDGRRVVFQTGVVMFEIDRTLQ